MNAVVVLYTFAAFNVAGALYLTLRGYNRKRKTIFTDIAKAAERGERAGQKRAAEHEWSNRD